MWVGGVWPRAESCDAPMKGTSRMLRTPVYFALMMLAAACAPSIPNSAADAELETTAGAGGLVVSADEEPDLFEECDAQS